MANCRLFSDSALTELITEFGTPHLEPALRQLKSPSTVLEKMRLTRPCVKNDKANLLPFLTHGDLNYLPLFFCFDNNWPAFFKACQENGDLAFQYLPLAIACRSDQIVTQLLPTARGPLGSCGNQLFTFIKRLLVAVISLPPHETTRDWFSLINAYSILNMPQNKRDEFDSLIGLYSAKYNNQIAFNFYNYQLKEKGLLPTLGVVEEMYIVAAASGNLTLIHSIQHLLQASFQSTQRIMAAQQLNFSDNLLMQTSQWRYRQAFLSAYQANQTACMNHFASLTSIILTSNLLAELIKIGQASALQFCRNNLKTLFTEGAEVIFSQISIAEIQLAAAKSLAMLETVRGFASKEIKLDQVCLENAGLSGQISCVNYVLAELKDKAVLTPTLLRNASLSGNPRLVEHILRLAKEKEVALKIEDLVHFTEESAQAIFSDTAEMVHFLKEQVEKHCALRTEAAVTLRYALGMYHQKLRVTGP